MVSFTFIMMAIIAGGFLLLTRVLPHVQPGYKRIIADLKLMRADMDKWLKDELVPIDREELELVSLQQLHQSVKKGTTLRAKGVFTTIYHEPVLAYSYKSYIASGKSALVYARTATHEYAYWLRDKEIQVLIDGKLMGTLNKEGVLYNDQNRMIARINRTQEDLAPVIVGEREVASVVKTQVQRREMLSPRAFQFVKSDITQEEEKIFLALATLELVEQSVPVKSTR
ncbi:MAG TPA: hypothetical protein PKD70_04015 [Saprospiraceae bacterium]|nr:hypothetical protein [Saprospiraceae bacterium]HMP13020.1 hypothetical protein [Saprospiraceae bacterium]